MGGFCFFNLGVLTLPTSVRTFASVSGPMVSSIYTVSKETLGCAPQEGIYTEHHFVLLNRHTLDSRVKTSSVHFITLQNKIVCL